MLDSKDLRFLMGDGVLPTRPIYKGMKINAKAYWPDYDTYEVVEGFLIEVNEDGYHFRDGKGNVRVEPIGLRLKKKQVLSDLLCDISEKLKKLGDKEAKLREAKRNLKDQYKEETKWL